MDMPIAAMLNGRNQSILAHGTLPITAPEYARLSEPVTRFIAEVGVATGLTMDGARQFPPLKAELFEVRRQ